MRTLNLPASLCGIDIPGLDEGIGAREDISKQEELATL